MINTKDILFTDVVLPEPFSLDELLRLPMFRAVWRFYFLSEGRASFHPSVKISAEALIGFLTKGQGQILVLEWMFFGDDGSELLERIVKVRSWLTC